MTNLTEHSVPRNWFSGSFSAYTAEVSLVVHNKNTEHYQLFGFSVNCAQQIANTNWVQNAQKYCRFSRVYINGCYCSGIIVEKSSIFMNENDSKNSIFQSNTNKLLCGCIMNLSFQCFKRKFKPNHECRQICKDRAIK